MKRRIAAWLLLATLLLTGCQTAPAETEPSATAAAESTPTEKNWEPFTGVVRKYTYYHEEGEARAWEEDIIYMSELYLDDYAQLTPYPSRVETRDDVYYDTERYDPELREYYLTRINDLIPRLDEMEDSEILFYLQETVAACHDAHLEVYTNEEELFPLAVEPLYAEDGSWGLYVVGCKAKDKELPYAQLTAINDIPVAEIVRLLEPYISYENDYWLLNRLTNTRFGAAMLCPAYLRRAGIMGQDDSAATFAFEGTDGQPFTRTLNYLNLFQFQNMNLDWYAMFTWVGHPFTEKINETNYYFESIESANAVYARIHKFYEDPGYTVLQYGNDLLALAREHDGLDYMILDLRSNPGGYQSLGFPEFFAVLERMEIGTVYVLIDCGTFSNGVITAGTIDARLDNAVLVGSPAGQPANFYGSVEDLTAPNGKITFRLPGAWWDIQPDNTEPALMPDILVWQTLEDYQNGVDTVLDAVWAMIANP